jgi:hypothetical protein
MRFLRKGRRRRNRFGRKFTQNDIRRESTDTFPVVLVLHLRARHLATIDPWLSHDLKSVNDGFIELLETSLVNNNRI